MPEQNTPLPYDPNRLFDALASWLGATTDKVLSRRLRLSPAVIDAIRCGRVPVRASILAAIAERAGRSIDELRCVLGDRRRKMRMSCSIQAA